MKCPYCGQEMEQGQILSRQRAFFWPDSAGEPPMLLVTKHAIQKGGGAPLWDAPGLFYLGCSAWACRSCGKLAADLDLAPIKTTD